MVASCWKRTKLVIILYILLLKTLIFILLFAEAWNIVKRLHSTAEDEAAIAFAKDEFYQMFTHLALERKRSAALGSKWNVLKRPSYRKRFWVGCKHNFLL